MTSVVEPQLQRGAYGASSESLPSPAMSRQVKLSQYSHLGGADSHCTCTMCDVITMGALPSGMLCLSGRMTRGRLAPRKSSYKSCPVGGQTQRSRTRMILTSASLLLLSALVRAAPSAQTAPAVTLDQGTFVGATDTLTNTNKFLGIPFAQPPYAYSESHLSSLSN